VYNPVDEVGPAPWFGLGAAGNAGKASFEGTD
jgi:hypothetical protein